MKEEVVVVTGASRGIGQQVVRRLARAGAVVVAAARSADGLAETCARVEQQGGRCLPVAGDVATFEGMNRLIQTAVKECGRVDVVVNNAGVATCAKMQVFDPSDFDRMMAINCHAVFYAARAVWPLFIKQGGGRLVNISSVAAENPFPGFQAYGATKAWVNTFTRALAEEGRAHNIGVYAIAPGAIDTSMLRDNFPDFPADQCLPPETIADAVAWILDPAARYATGSVVTVRKS